MRRVLQMLAAAAAGLLMFVALGGTASAAGQWVQVSCENPDGSAAPSSNWAATANTTDGYSGTASASCNPSTPMSAELPDSTAAPDGAYADLTYGPPVGSTLAGGTIQLKLSADGYGSMSSGTALLLSPVNSPSDEVQSCAHWSDGCWSGASVGNGGPSDFSGPVSLPAGTGGQIIDQNACLSESGAGPCEDGGANGVWAGTWVYWSDALLDSTQTPVGSQFSGSLLKPNAHGTAQLDFIASEGQGPGIYMVTVDIDNKPVYNQTPSTAGAECTPVGNYQATGALEFDGSQPCELSDQLQVPVTTTALPNGSHQLTIDVTDAAGNSEQVYSGPITIDNPIANQLPKARKGVSLVRVRFTSYVSFRGSRTRLSTLSESALPRGARVRVLVSGRHAPRPKLTSATRAGSGKLLRELRGLSFSPGDTLTFIVSAPHRRAERVQVRFRDRHDPTVALL